ncbi:MAG: hypothetical protein KF814_18800 [Nitrospiraceae bacterium]|nr:hypothetical protein [Nitrospira sp. CR1.1]MBX3238203.1 hypothetical protein [Nitrospiraceae bacterium]
MSVDAPTYPASDHRAALYSALLPGLGQLLRGRHNAAMLYGLVTIFLIALSFALGRLSGRAAEVFFFMLLALPWWALQSYDAALGPAASGSDLARTGRQAWAEGHDIRFLGLLFLVSAANDAIIIAKNPDYLLPFFCTKLDGAAGFVTKALSPFLHTWVGYGFVRVKKWSLLVYLVYAAYGTTNALVNLTCFGPGRIRNTLLIALMVFTSYILWRRRLFQR